MRAGLIASSLAHAGVVVLALVSFATPSPFDTPQPEPLNVDVITASEFTQMTKGNERGKKTETKKVVAEKVDAPKPVEDPNLKVTEKEEIKASAPPPPPPPPTPAPPRPEEPKPTPPTPKVEEPKPAPTPPKADKPPEPKVEQKADEGLKADPKKDQQKQEAQTQPPPPPPQRRPTVIPPKPQPATANAQSQEKFDTDRIAALLDKRTPQRNAAADQQVSQTASLGAPRGEAQTLTMSDIAALQARIQSCWNPPAGASDAGDLRAVISVRFKPDGSLQVQPQVTGVTPASSPYAPAFADSATRAIIRCAPYTFLPANKYDSWKDIEMGFSLDQMLGRVR
ncbi:hypothetical protein GCM10007301_00450 [Azorhizobium oxalatiphilum]|uniref:Cell division and transport-associated protein TolA n=1 Tax=Azorhizobium oxalatiphilum TaxID=980631 RepID=A0A917BK38_9HYPH|nr:cell envelope biogenesis protein TolA [Azorhizobium oxalatiphilum]GGF44856.1 hypothetical protein GCM10007301_00450 [Azorhizobium oxalatiphilum]